MNQKNRFISACRSIDAQLKHIILKLEYMEHLKSLCKEVGFKYTHIHSGSPFIGQIRMCYKIFRIIDTQEEKINNDIRKLKTLLGYKKNDET